MKKKAMFIGFTGLLFFLVLINLKFSINDKKDLDFSLSFMESLASGYGEIDPNACITTSTYMWNERGTDSNGCTVEYSCIAQCCWPSGELRNVTCAYPVTLNCPKST